MGLTESLDSLLHHKAGAEWGGWLEILFWMAVLLLHGALITFAAWRLAGRHTDATGSSVLVPIKAKAPDPTSATSSSSFLLPRRRTTSSTLPS
ncbi:hypothetical protein L7F22_031605 [Adiantum nelumboides]|nr:hypothetical protein [Adiantum nelumboides]